jgi:hypothetical protein
LRKFLFGLLTLAIFAPIAAYSNTTTVYANYDIRNKSDQCVFFIFPNQKVGTTQGYLKPGESSGRHFVVVGNAFGVHYSVRIEATIQNCQTRQQIGPMRYDYIPSDATSELSIHGKSPGGYIMRHGP